MEFSKNLAVTVLVLFQKAIYRQSRGRVRITNYFALPPPASPLSSRAAPVAYTSQVPAAAARGPEPEKGCHVYAPDSPADLGG